MNCDQFFKDILLLHESGKCLFPVVVKDRATGIFAFRVSQGGKRGNTKLNERAVDAHEMKDLFLNHGYAVRASSIDRTTHGLYKKDERSIDCVYVKY